MKTRVDIDGKIYGQLEGQSGSPELSFIYKTRLTLDLEKHP